MNKLSSDMHRVEEAIKGGYECCNIHYQRLSFDHKLNPHLFGTRSIISSILLHKNASECHFKTSQLFSHKKTGSKCFLH